MQFYVDLLEVLGFYFYSNRLNNKRNIVQTIFAKLRNKHFLLSEPRNMFSNVSELILDPFESIKEN